MSRPLIRQDNPHGLHPLTQSPVSSAELFGLSRTLGGGGLPPTRTDPEIPANRRTFETHGGAGAPRVILLANSPGASEAADYCHLWSPSSPESGKSAAGGNSPAVSRVILLANTLRRPIGRSLGGMGALGDRKLRVQTSQTNSPAVSKVRESRYRHHFFGAICHPACSRRDRQGAISGPEGDGSPGLSGRVRNV